MLIVNCQIIVARQMVIIIRKKARTVSLGYTVHGMAIQYGYTVWLYSMAIQYGYWKCGLMRVFTEYLLMATVRMK